MQKIMSNRIVTSDWRNYQIDLSEGELKATYKRLPLCEVILVTAWGLPRRISL